MLISATVIRKPRRNRRCEICSKFIGPQPTLRLYGAAETGDKPYLLWFHVPCAQNWTGFDPKITAALQQFAAPINDGRGG
jgi:hypothetical protein